MIGQSSSLMMRWASGMVRERFAVATSSFFSAPIFFNGFGLFNNNNHPQFLPLLSPCGAASIPVPQLPEAGGDQQHIWFAVPKSKISRSRKRMKTTRQKRIPMKKNIVFDPRTGEVTLLHKMPSNWKDYLPKMEE
jgi:ribosomal protein L32